MTYKLPSFFLLFYCSGEKMRNWFPLEHVRDDWKGDEYMNCWFWKVSLLQRKWAGCGQLSNRTQFMHKTNKAEHQGRHCNFNHHNTHLMPLSSSSLPQHRVAEVGSLSASAKMATNFFVRRLVAIFARNASFLPLIAIYPLNSVHYTIFIMW